MCWELIPEQSTAYFIETIKAQTKAFASEVTGRRQLNHNCRDIKRTAAVATAPSDWEKILKPLSLQWDVKCLSNQKLEAPPISYLKQKSLPFSGSKRSGSVPETSLRFKLVYITSNLVELILNVFINWGILPGAWEEMWLCMLGSAITDWSRGNGAGMKLCFNCQHPFHRWWAHSCKTSRPSSRICCG